MIVAAAEVLDEPSYRELAKELAPSVGLGLGISNLLWLVYEAKQQQQEIFYVLVTKPPPNRFKVLTRDEFLELVADEDKAKNFQEAVLRLWGRLRGIRRDADEVKSIQEAALKVTRTIRTGETYELAFGACYRVADLEALSRLKPGLGLQSPFETLEELNAVILS